MKTIAEIHEPIRLARLITIINGVLWYEQYPLNISQNKPDEYAIMILYLKLIKLRDKLKEWVLE